MVMSSFSSDELSRMQAAQSSAMMDTCLLREYVSVDGHNEYGVPIRKWVDRGVFSCGFDPAPQAEANVPAGEGDTQVPMELGMVRLPHGTDVENLDRVIITHRYGVLLDEPMEYNVIETPREGPSGITVRVELVTNG